MSKRILVVSDTHGNIEPIYENVKDENLDLIIHLGDNWKDGFKLSEMLNTKISYVMGNCDYLYGEVDEEKLIEINGKRIFFTHGHRYGVKMNLTSLFYRGKELDADLVLYGHTHIPYLNESEGMIILNPGSPSLPRGRSSASYSILNIDEEIKIDMIKI